MSLHHLACVGGCTRSVQGKGGPLGEVWSTSTTVSGYVFGHVLAADLQQAYQISTVDLSFQGNASSMVLIDNANVSAGEVPDVVIVDLDDMGYTARVSRCQSVCVRCWSQNHIHAYIFEVLTSYFAWRTALHSTCVPHALNAVSGSDDEAFCSCVQRNKDHNSSTTPVTN